MDLLDDIKVDVKRKPIFAIFAIVCPILVILLVGYVGKNLDANNEIPYEMLTAYLIIGFFIFGAVSLILCFVRKEKPVFLKWVASLLYTLLIITFGIIIIYDL